MGKENIGEFISALKVTGSLFLSKRARRDPEIRRVYRAMGQTRPEAPYIVEDDLLNSFTRIVEEREIAKNEAKLDGPYWLLGTKYNPLEIYISAIQFFDDHSEPLPLTTLPLSEHVQEYGDFIFKSGRKVTLPEQFTKLLAITGNNVVGAANLGFIASRVYARGGDTRAYPDINVGASDIMRWSRKLSNFETYGASSANDAAGDTYYFWTHFFAASVYTTLRTNESTALNGLFGRGTEIMRFIRGSIVGQPTVTEHREASILGRNIGLAITDLVAK